MNRSAAIASALAAALLSSCSTSADLCAASIDPAAYLGEEVTGQVAIISASPHGIYFEQRCEGRYGFILIDTLDTQESDRIAAFLHDVEMRPPSKGDALLEAVVTGTVDRTRQGGWGLRGASFRKLKLLPVKGSGYRGAELIEKASRREAQIDGGSKD